LVSQRNELREISHKQIQRISGTLMTVKQKQEQRIEHLNKLIPSFERLLASMSAASEPAGASEEDALLSADLSSGAQIQQLCDQFQSWKGKSLLYMLACFPLFSSLVLFLSLFCR
jgi:hypothetical protein